MAKDTPSVGSSPKIVRRFTRLPVDREVADLAQRVWKRPTFSAREVNGSDLPPGSAHVIIRHLNR
jgi:hypothetical protein